MATHDLPRLFVPEATAGSAEPDATWPMDAGQARYLGTVLRRGEGSEVRLFNARDGEWLARIDGLRRDRGGFRLERLLRAPEPATGGIVLCFALLKRDATDLVIRMGTELGVQRFMPLITERTNAQRVNGDRLRTIAEEAAEQCERLDVPEIDEPVRLAQFLGTWSVHRTLFAAIERMASRGLDHAPFPVPAPGDGLLIGPEGGLSGGELDLLRSRSFIKPVTLGERVLRAETAVAYGLALLDDRMRNGSPEPVHPE